MTDPQVPFKRGSDTIDAANLPFTPAVLANWTGSADPGSTKAAIDQVAGRLTTVEGAVPAALATTLGRIRQIAVAASAEAAEAITLTITLTDGTGATPGTATRVRVYISTDAAGTSAVNSAAFVVADAGNGTIDNADTGNAVWTCLTGASAQVVLSVTDQAASGSTLYVWVEVLADGTTPLISARVRKSITFTA